ncbi:hypothetical protein V2J09_020779 [Rumex salicifolius]
MKSLTARALCAGNGLAGMKQRDLLRWNSKQQIQNSAYISEEELRNEVKKIGAIIERCDDSFVVYDDSLSACDL